MLATIIYQYLASHKRLVVPQLGAFLVKEPGGSVVFSELMKRDDGVLRGVLRDEGMGELEAAGEIDRFVFEVRHAVEHGDEYVLDGFGILKPGPNTTVAFEYRPVPVAPEAAAKADGEAAGIGGAEADASVSRGPADDAACKPIAAGAAAPAARSAEAGPKGRSQIRPDKVAEAVETAFADPHVSTSVKMNPEPYVRGLKYGKPRKTTDAYRYVDRAPRRRRFDRFLLLAIIAAGIAVAAIAFGYWRDLHEREAEAAATEQVHSALGMRTAPARKPGSEAAGHSRSAPAPVGPTASAAASGPQTPEARQTPDPQTTAAADPLIATEAANPNKTDK